jgi:hypothetical protein
VSARIAHLSEFDGCARMDTENGHIVCGSNRCKSW